MEKKYKILQALYSGLGGQASVAFTLAEGFKKKDLANYFVFYGVERADENYLKNISLKNDIDDFIEIQKKTYIGLKEWVKYYKYLKKIKPDVILLHTDQLILASFLYKILNNAKIITIEHDSISLRTRKKWFISNLNAIFADNIVVLNESYKKHVQEKLWFKKLIKKYAVIPNGIDEIKYYLNENLFKKKTINIFMASRINDLRDHETLIEAILEVKKIYPKIFLRIAGEGDKLNFLKKKYENNENIYFLGNLDESNIIKELQKADIYIHATLAENFSTAILQAMSSGLPIITSDIEGTRHMINSNNGILYKSRDIKDLSGKIIFLIENQQKAIQFGLKAREDVINNYSIKKVINKYLPLFDF